MLHNPRVSGGKIEVYESRGEHVAKGDCVD